MNIDEKDYNWDDLETEAIKNSSFFEQLHHMTERVKCFNHHFNSKLQRHEENFQKR